MTANVGNAQRVPGSNAALLTGMAGLLMEGCLPVLSVYGTVVIGLAAGCTVSVHLLKGLPL
jgi:hypothetical protein